MTTRMTSRIYMNIEMDRVKGSDSIKEEGVVVGGRG